MATKLVLDSMHRATDNAPFDLQRFVDAQAPVYVRVVAELGRGRKESHWMWFIFPQAAGLGRSAMSERYAIRSADEARAFLAHPVLGTRFRECTALVDAALKTRTLEEIFGEVDAMKFRSCMDIFREGPSHDFNDG